MPKRHRSSDEPGGEGGPAKASRLAVEDSGDAPVETPSTEDSVLIQVTVSLRLFARTSRNFPGSDGCWHRLLDNMMKPPKTNADDAIQPSPAASVPGTNSGAASILGALEDPQLVAEVAGETAVPNQLDDDIGLHADSTTFQSIREEGPSSM